MANFKRGKDKNIDKEAKIIIIDHEKCKPKTTVYDYLVSKSKLCPKECIILKDKKIEISENCCMVCFNSAKRSPGNAVSVVKLPTNLQTNVTYCYGKNSFKIHGLPTPQPGTVLGLLGINGIGKSTALNILSGKLLPNFGNIDKDVPTKKDIIKYYRGSELQNYFNKIYNKKTKVCVKPQNIFKYVTKYKGQNIQDLINKIDQRNKKDEICEKLQISHLFERNIEDLSGGELQRLIIAFTVMSDADVYFFDECSSFLDVKQRLVVNDIIRGLIDPINWNSDNKAKSKYIIVVEHDLAILDYVSDYIQCLYGKPSVYGVVSNKINVNNGINEFMEGYIRSENVKFRPYELSFKNSLSLESKILDSKQKQIYPKMTKHYESSGFKINIEEGHFHNNEIICLMGENGSGKTTFINLLSQSLSNLSYSHKQQHLENEYSKINLTVEEYMEQKINKSLGDKNFKFMVLNPLNINSIKDIRVCDLSGGQLQRLAITICLGTPAYLYLIDEPSAGLDCEQRVIVSKVIQKWLIEYLNRTCFLIEHDFLMTSTIADTIIVFEGQPGIECKANKPICLKDGFNKFLKNLNVTFRRDPNNFRPRINKKNSTKDREQKLANEYFLFD
ncbi:ABC transporter [seawater metagenome]|uniref:ABC transporter n=1 Tax=seawater metagenome TaxID=1561972 RepID=A0A5E8CFR3_9ZZZZ